MKKTITLEQDDINHLHDVIMEALNFTESIPNDVVIGVYYHLPKHIKDEAEHWGLSDTVVRDNIFKWIRDNKNTFRK